MAKTLAVTGPTDAAAQLELRDLRLIRAIAAEGTVTRASLRLHLTQPAASRHLRALEARLGTPLFVRGRGRMAPTAAGDLLVRHAGDVLDRIAQVEGEVRALSERPRRTLRIGTECYTGYHWLPTLSTRFATMNPAIEVEIAFDAASRPVESLRAERIDVAVVTSDQPLPGLVVSRLFTDELVAVVRPQHPWASRAFVDPAAFAHVRLLLLSPPSTSAVIKRFLVPAKVRPFRVADVQLVGAMAALVEADYGVGVLPSWVMAPDVRAGRLVAIRLGRRGLYRTWSVVVRKDSAREHWVQPLVHALSTGAVAARFGQPTD